MNEQDYLRGLPDREITMTTQKAASDFLATLAGPTHTSVISDRLEAGDKKAILEIPLAIGQDLLEMTTQLSLRSHAYKLHRTLGLSTLQALKYSSPSMGRATAALTAPREL
jgi:hypothetical protein